MEQGAANLRVAGTLNDGVALLHAHGDMDLATAQAVRDAVCDALDEGAREVVVDLSGLRFLDSTGLSVLLHAARDVARRGASLRTIAPAGSEARLVMDLARLGGLLHLEPLEPA